MALAPTPEQYDPTGILLKQRDLYVEEGIMKCITAQYLADKKAAQDADDAADALLSAEAKAADDAAEEAAAAKLAAKKAASHKS
jgi:hypothetical protein